MDTKEKEYIAVRNLTKKYRCKNNQEILVLDQISFTMREGEFLCIVGESGCGKSTLLRVMSGLDTDYEGKIIIGHTVVDKPDRQKGFVYQESRLFPWMTVRQNISFVLNEGSRWEKKEKAEEMLELIGMKEFGGSYPKELSGGMAQRVNIARALVNEPRVLFLDEPFGALDAFTKMRLQSELLKIKKQCNNTMLLVTHDMEEAVYLADRVAVLGGRPGKVLAMIDVDLEQPRDRGSAAFLEIRKKIHTFFTGGKDEIR